ncbi:MAG: hypothetical protein IRZ02_04600 [Acidothermus sp.]|nr:hypothetical protein [Acidothermus sp.]MCL6538734.1 DUF6221 family protein [Acidothermus sp.]
MAHSRSSFDDLVEWLLLQIAEDEMKARTAGGQAWRWKVLDQPTQRDALVRADGTVCADSWGADRQETGFRGAEAKMFIERFGPDRILADCEAKRRMLARLQTLARAWWTTTRAADEARSIIREMAVPYAGRPGYRDEWRPDLAVRALRVASS